jgi:hypothetical protein
VIAAVLVRRVVPPSAGAYLSAAPILKVSLAGADPRAVRRRDLGVVCLVASHALVACSSNTDGEQPHADAAADVIIDATAMAPVVVSDAAAADGAADTGNAADAPAADAPAADAPAADASAVDGRTAVADSSGGADAPADGPPADAAPFVAAFPQVIYRGGKTLTNPKLYVITYDNYGQRAEIEDFMKTLVASGDGYWTPVTKDYGIGAATTSILQLAGSAPTAIDDQQVAAFLAHRLDGSHTEWGTPDENPVYMFFFPSTTRVTNATLVGCSSFNGYHNWTTLPSGKWAGTKVAYLVVPECTGGAGSLFNVTSAASHELIETLTDPFWTSSEGLGWWGLAPEFKIWEFLRGGEGEVGDLCEGVHLANYTPMAFGFKYRIQRTWSNSASLAGHNPCQPWSPQTYTYFTAIPDLRDDVTLRNYQETFKTKGVKIPLGGERTIAVHLHAGGPFAPWTVTASDLAPLFGVGPRLSFTWSTNTGVSGDVLQLKIKYLAGTARFGGAPFMLTSSDGGFRHEWYGYVSAD